MFMKRASALACGVCTIAMAVPARAQTRSFAIPAGSLKSALDAFGRQAGRPIIYQADQVQDVRSPGVSGTYSIEAALRIILSDSGFTIKADISGAIAIVMGNASGEGQAGGAAGRARALRSS